MNNIDNNNQILVIGKTVQKWTRREIPSNEAMNGKYCYIEKLDVEKHAENLFNAYSIDFNNQDWTYLPYGPFKTKNKFIDWLNRECISENPLFYTIIDKKNNKPVGMASYLRINPKHGVIEVGHIHYSPLMQQQPIGTEAMYLMMKRVFEELCYRRYEWKCDSLNKRSCNSALRFGFKFEGIFKQHMVYKGRNRDTAWYSIIDKDWLQIKNNYEKWLDKENFNDDGSQKTSLRSLM